MKGNIHRIFLESKCLANNKAAQDSKRPLLVYTPPELASSKTQRLPVLYILAPWTSAGRQQFDWKPFKESLPERLERLTQHSNMPPCIVVAPDLYTRYGGSQYINSDFFGPHSEHILEEVIPYVEKHFQVLPGYEHRGVFGRSSGGFGALRLACDFPASFAGVACHSGDLGFELLFGGDLQSFPRLLAKHRCDVQAFLDYAFSSDKLSSSEVHLLMLLGCAGFYSPNSNHPLGFDIPIDLYSGKINRDVWQRWLSNDPVTLCQKPESISNLKKLSYLYLECGRFDQYHLLYGARQLNDILKLSKVAHTYEEFDDNHSGTDYRYDVSLPSLVRNLAANAI